MEILHCTRPVHTSIVNKSYAVRYAKDRAHVVRYDDARDIKVVRQSLMRLLMVVEVWGSSPLVGSS